MRNCSLSPTYAIRSARVWRARTCFNRRCNKNENVTINYSIRIIDQVYMIRLQLPTYDSSACYESISLKGRWTFTYRNMIIYIADGINTTSISARIHAFVIDTGFLSIAIIINRTFGATFYAGISMVSLNARTRAVVANGINTTRIQ